MSGYTQEQLDSLRAAIASGVTEVRHGDKSIRYQSLEQMRALEKDMASTLAATNTNGRASTASFSRD